MKAIICWLLLNPEFLLAMVFSFNLPVVLSAYTLLKASLINIGRYDFPVTSDVSTLSKTNSIPLNNLLFIKALSIVFKSNSTFSYLSYSYCLNWRRPFFFLRSQILRRISIAGLFFLEVFPV
ncbi:hypothetical protein D3C80_1137370 [compost metagenome]